MSAAMISVMPAVVPGAAGRTPIQQTAGGDGDQQGRHQDGTETGMLAALTASAPSADTRIPRPAGRPGAQPTLSVALNVGG